MLLLPSPCSKMCWEVGGLGKGYTVGWFLIGCLSYSFEISQWIQGSLHNLNILGESFFWNTFIITLYQMPKSFRKLLLLNGDGIINLTVLWKHSGATHFKNFHFLWKTENVLVVFCCWILTRSKRCLLCETEQDTFICFPLRGWLWGRLVASWLRVRNVRSAKATEPGQEEERMGSGEDHI